jgi:hypothetical protein
MITEQQTARAYRFDGDDYRNLIDVLIEACTGVGAVLSARRSEHPTVEIGGKRLSLEEAATLVAEVVGYDTPLLPHHANAVKSAGHWKRCPTGYGRAAHALVRKFISKSMPAFAAIGSFQADEKAQAALDTAHREFAAKMASAVELAAIEAHPAWTEVQGEVLIVDGRAFVKSGSGPSTTEGLAKWFRKNHGDDAARVERALREARRAELLGRHGQRAPGWRDENHFSPVVAELVARAESGDAP